MTLQRKKPLPAAPPSLPSPLELRPRPASARFARNSSHLSALSPKKLPSTPNLSELRKPTAFALKRSSTSPSLTSRSQHFSTFPTPSPTPHSKNSLPSSSPPATVSPAKSLIMPSPAPSPATVLPSSPTTPSARASASSTPTPRTPPKLFSKPPPANTAKPASYPRSSVMHPPALSRGTASAPSITSFPAPRSTPTA